MLTSVSQRFMYFIEKQGLSIRSVEKDCNFSNGYIKKTQSYKEDKLNSIIDRFPNLNIEWLMTGNGQMVNPTKVKEAKPIAIETNDVFFNKNGVKCTQLEDGTYKMEIKLVPQKAHLGYKKGYADPEYIENLPLHTIYVDEIKRGFYRAFEAIGDSMYDKNNADSIKDGAIVVGRNISQDLWKYKLHINQWNEFLIVDKEEGLMVKQIIDHDVENGIITCHSYNPDKETYPDFKLNLNDVSELFNIVGVTNPRR